jgi:Domain of unknown function (DUF4404)
MDDDEIRRKLEQLHDEIEHVDHVDARGRAILRDVDGHIRELLARSEMSSLEPKPAMTRGIEDAIRHFEVTHPTLTAALSDLLTALSNAGI